MERITREQKTVNPDLTVPINNEEIMSTASGCFGKLWDLRTSECSKCADRDVCGILFNDNVVKPRTQEIQEEQGAIFLDLTDFKKVTDEKIFNFIESGVTTVQALVAHVGALACTSERVATVEFLKRFIKSNDKIFTKEGIVWLR